MIRLLVLVPTAAALALLVFSLSEAAPGTANRPDFVPSVQGVSFGIPEAEVFRKLGEPSGQTSEEAEESLGMGPTKELQYSGLVIGLHQRPGSDEFSVWRFVVTEQDWEIAPGFEIGNHRTQVREFLGPPDSVSKEADTTTLHFGIAAFDGWYWARFRGGLLTEFGATEDWS